ncbi:MAG: DinB family protein [Vicinamibacterales bacterium]
MLRVRSVRQLVPALVISGLALAATATPAHAQDVMSKEAAAVVKAYYLADLEALRVKFVGLAEAFPADKLSFRPMDGVRSTAEVLMLLATEGYGYAPGAVGAPPAMPREEMQKLRAISDKAQIIDHLNKGFAYAKTEIGKIDAATLTGKRKMGNNERNAVESIGAVLGDMHEHLGQLIAYARMNKIVPPWSK